MSKSFKLLVPCGLPSFPQPDNINWELCVICQKQTSESLTSPTLSRRHDIGRGYKSLAENLFKFNELGKLPKSLQLNRIDEGQGIEAALIDNDAKWHHTCILNYNKTMLQRAEKKKEETPIDITSDELPPKHNRLRSFSTAAFASEASCFSVDNQLVQTFFTRHPHIRLTTMYGRVLNLLRTICS